jgi:hypothetical protein
VTEEQTGDMQTSAHLLKTPKDASSHHGRKKTRISNTWRANRVKTSPIARRGSGENTPAPFPNPTTDCEGRGKS